MGQDHKNYSEWLQELILNYQTIAGAFEIECAKTLNPRSENYNCDPNI